MTKDKKKRERKLRKQTTRKILKDIPGVWVSNANKKDAAKIIKAFPQILQGAPQPSKGWSTLALIEDDIVGLYKEVKNV